MDLRFSMLPFGSAEFPNSAASINASLQLALSLSDKRLCMKVVRFALRIFFSGGKDIGVCFIETKNYKRASGIFSNMK